MSSVSQMVPTYSLGGISNQPDELKKPGQVRDCVNAFPDLIDGLYKRNGFQYIDQLANPCKDPDAVQTSVAATGTWFNFVRNNAVDKSTENFVGKVNTSGEIFVWDSATGQPVDVYYSEGIIDPNNAEAISLDNLQTCSSSEYLLTEKRNTLKFNSVNDYTFISNPEVGVTLSSPTPKRPFEAFIEITQLAPAREYLLNVDLVNQDSTTAYRTATKAEIVAVTDFGGDRKDPSCPGIYRNPSLEVDNTWLRDTEDRGQTGLILDIESTGVQVREGDDYECRYRHSVSIVNGGRGWKKGDKVKIYQNGGNTAVDTNDPGYTVEITEVDRIESYTEFAVTGVVTSNTGDTVLKIKDVLDEMKTQLIAQAGFTEEQIEVIGNGLYLTRSEPFIISTTEKDLMNILSNEDQEQDNPVVVVNNVSRLPIECRDGIIAKVSNSFVAEDDYWVQFKSNYGGPTGASGYWQEVPEPGGKVSFNAGTMPHALVYARNNGVTVFVFGPVKWNDRECGTEDFSPSFVDFSINYVSFFRNRLVFLSRENVIMSRSGDLFNFFPTSALTVSPTDPIDITGSTNYSSVLQDALIINNGMVLFSNYQQFLLTTDSDILDPTTAKLTEISRYEYNSDSRPFAIGTNIGFVGTSNQNSRLYEMSGIFREGSVDIAERSEIIAKSLPAGLNLVTQSKETGLIMLSKPGSKDIWNYRYFKEGANQDIQTTWFRWVAPYPVYHHFILDDCYYAVLKDPDNRAVLTKVALETMQGPYIDLGTIPYEMKVEFPTINLVKRELNTFMADTTSSLVIHRVIFNLADIGTYNIKIERDGMETYDMLYESRYMDEYVGNAVPVYPDVARNVPTYTRNESLDITLYSSFSLPLILRSMRWEGDYNQRYYKRV